LGAGIHIAHLISHIPLPTQMDATPSINRRKKSDKAKEKHARTPYSSQHVRHVIAATTAAKKPKNK
jgi:hypothetical protein